MDSAPWAQASVLNDGESTEGLGFVGAPVLCFSAWCSGHCCKRQLRTPRPRWSHGPRRLKSLRRQSESCGWWLYAALQQVFGRPASSQGLVPSISRIISPTAQQSPLHRCPHQYSDKARHLHFLSGRL